MQKYIDVVQTRTGTAVSGATVYIYATGTTNLSTIYSDDGITPKANPMTTDSSGEFSFYAADGDYDIRVVYGSTDVTKSDISIGEFGTADINGGTIDGTVIGGSTPAAITGTTITASTRFVGAHDGTVGATTPASGAFTTLSASGNAALGDAVTDAHTITGDVSISGDGVAITATSSGTNVARFVGPANAYADVTDGTGTFRVQLLSNVPHIGASSNHGLNLVTNNTVRMSITSTGDISTTGNVTLGDASTDAHTINGYASVGGTAPNAGVALRVALGSGNSGTTQIGLETVAQGTSGATSRITCYQATGGTAAASYTVANLIGCYVTDALQGAGSTITNQYGFLALDQTKGANNYGIASQVSSGANKWNIYASGTATNYFNGLIDLNAGQIKFPATQVASSDANTLDDYEEGTWTPVLAFGGASVGITYTAQQGRYTKVGNTVHFLLYILLSSKGSSVGSATITGLPFTSGANITRTAISSTATSLSTSPARLAPFLGASSSSITLQISTDAGSLSNFADTDFSATTSWYVSGHYEV